MPYKCYNNLMKDKGKIIFGVLFVVALFVGAVFAAGYIQDNSNLQELISSFGYLGVFIVSVIGGLNLFIPVPATAFIPVFIAAGLSLPLMISVMVIGTTTADLASYYLGTLLKTRVEKPNYKIYKFVKKWCEGKPKATQLIVFLYAAFIPFPNELLLLPLGTLGVKLRTLILAFTLGTAIHITGIAYGLSVFI